jgi:hypothetical protein
MLQTYLLHCTSPKVLSSSEDLLPAELSQACLFEQFPFLEAIWTSLVQSLSEGQLVRIPFVHAPHPKLRGYYHFEFSPTSLPLLLCLYTSSIVPLKRWTNERSYREKMNRPFIIHLSIFQHKSQYPCLCRNNYCTNSD